MTHWLADPAPAGFCFCGRAPFAQHLQPPRPFQAEAGNARLAWNDPLIPAQAGIQGPGLGPRFRGDERK